MVKKILVIEDEKSLARFVSLELQHEGYDVETESSGRVGLDKALSTDFDLILLDLLLPDLDGFEITRRLRSDKKTAIIMMSERDAVMDIVAGLDRGADDYVVKPFAIEELLARVRAIFRRQDMDNHHQATTPTGQPLTSLTLNAHNRSAVRGDDEIPLTKREYDLLNMLLTNANRVMTREELLAGVWQYDANIETNVVDVYIRYLRGKIDVPGKDSYIQTIRGLGYIIREK